MRRSRGPILELEGPGQGAQGACGARAGPVPLCSTRTVQLYAAALRRGLTTDRGGRKGPFWMGALSLPLPSPLPSIPQSVAGAPSSCQPFLAAGEFSQTGTWRRAPTEAGCQEKAEEVPDRVPTKLSGSQIRTWPPLPGAGL